MRKERDAHHHMKYSRQGSHHLHHSHGKGCCPTMLAIGPASSPTLQCRSSYQLSLGVEVLFRLLPYFTLRGSHMEGSSRNADHVKGSSIFREFRILQGKLRKTDRSGCSNGSHNCGRMGDGSESGSRTTRTPWLQVTKSGVLLPRMADRQSPARLDQ